MTESKTGKRVDVDAEEAGEPENEGYDCAASKIGGPD